MTSLQSWHFFKMLRDTLIVVTILKAPKKLLGRRGKLRGRRRVFFLPSPSSILNPTISPLKSVFDLPQLSVMPNAQDGRRALVPEKVALFTLQIHLLYRLCNDQHVNNKCG